VEGLRTQELLKNLTSHMAASATVHLIVFLGNAVGRVNAGSFHGVQFGSGVLILYMPSWGLLMVPVICRIMASWFHHCLGLVLVVGVEKAGVSWFLMFCCIVMTVFMIKP
jgi:hypothetical protein